MGKSFINNYLGNSFGISSKYDSVILSLSILQRNSCPYHWRHMHIINIYQKENYAVRQDNVQTSSYTCEGEKEAITLKRDTERDYLLLRSNP